MPPRVILFAKAPLPGFAKTRLIPALGEVGAAELAGQLLAHALAEAIGAGLGAVELCVTPAPDDPSWHGFDARGARPEWSDQGGGDLGERMARASERGLAHGGPVMLIGSDCPALDRHQMREAAGSLQYAEAVMIPASDGGYVLLGLRRFDPSLFSGIAWSTASVARETVARCVGLGWRLDCMAPLPDIDEPADLAQLPQQFMPASRKNSAVAATNCR